MLLYTLARSNSLFGEDYIEEKNLSQKCGDLRCIEIPCVGHPCQML